MLTGAVAPDRHTTRCVKVFLYFIGRGRDQHGEAMASDFVRRTSRWVRIEMHEVRTRHGNPISRHSEATRIALDPSGRRMTSAGFAELVHDAQLRGRDLVFLVGGAEGLPEAWRKGADALLSLSPMTFPHGLARVVLAEQVYRAFATLRGHPYPR